MVACCQAYDLDNRSPTRFDSVYDFTRLPRWLVEGFWTMTGDVEARASHSNWDKRKAADPVYFATAYDRMRQLADWFFTGHCPVLNPGSHFAPM